MMEFGFDHAKSKMAPDTPLYFSATVINWEGMGIDPAIIGLNSRRVQARFEPCLEVLSEEPVAIVAYGPSLRDTWEEIGGYKHIITCSGAHKFLIECGIIPTHHVESDPRPHKVAMLGEPQEHTQYLTASCCDANYLDRLERFHVKLWHILFSHEAAYREIPTGDWIITGGNTIGPRAVKIARLLGFVNFHLYGFDASGRHAGEHTNPVPADRFKAVHCDGKTFQTTTMLFTHMSHALKDFHTIPNAKFTFHGEGLMQSVAKKWSYRFQPGYPLAVVKDD